MFRVNRPDAAVGQFATTLIFPLASLRLGDLDPAQWLPGPWEPGLEHAPGGAYIKEASSGFSSKDRRMYFANPDVVKPYLRKKFRRHRHCDVTDHGRTLRLDAMEVVRVPEGWNKSRFLLVHLVAIGNDPKASLATLATLARPQTNGWQELANHLDLIGGEESGWTHSRSLPRAASISLSQQPRRGERGLIDWPGGTPEQFRLADMLTLPRNGRTLSREYAPDLRRPSPVFEIAVSGTSVSAVRVNAEAAGKRLDDRHISELRTYWTDAFLVELAQQDTAEALIRETRKLVKKSRIARVRNPFLWSQFARKFRQWRTDRSWQAAIDHPMDSAIAQMAREQLGTPRLLERVEADIADHERASTARATWFLSVGVAIVGIVPLIRSIERYFF